MERNRLSEALHDITCSVLESLVFRAGGEDARLVLACYLVDSHGDVESCQRWVALELDGSSLCFVLGIVGVRGPLRRRGWRPLHPSPHRGKMRNEREYLELPCRWRDEFSWGSLGNLGEIGKPLDAHIGFGSIRAACYHTKCAFSDAHNDAE
jgi:hypothetical protein